MIYNDDYADHIYIQRITQKKGLKIPHFHCVKIQKFGYCRYLIV